MSEYQEEVLTNILDLQAELRGDEPEPHEEKVTTRRRKAKHDDTVTVAEGDLAVSSTPAAPPTSVGVNERLAALNARLSQLEYELAGVAKRIQRIEPDVEAKLAEDEDADAEADLDAPWRSFVDLQRIVADRLDRR